MHCVKIKEIYLPLLGYKINCRDVVFFKKIANDPLCAINVLNLSFFFELVELGNCTVSLKSIKSNLGH